MTQIIDRRSLLKKGFLSLGGLTLASHITEGAGAHMPMWIDTEDRIFHSPLMREHYAATAFGAIKAKLNANENPYGPPASAQKAIKESVVGGNRYAWKELSQLVGILAKKEGVTPDHIMMGPGSSDLLEKVAMVLFQSGGNIVSADPTYMSLIRVAESCGAKWKPVPTGKSWEHDLKAMEAAIDKDTKLVYICNPNNPTGSITKSSDLLDFCSRVSEKVPIFVDEAYIELAEGTDTKSMVELLSQKKNVIIARTFSKIMGMAGLRVGYITALPSFLKQIEKITRGGMGISYTSVLGAIASFEDKDFQKETKLKNTAAKEYLYAELTKLGYSYIPSYTNFVLFPIKMNGKEMLKKMDEQGVAVRSFEIMGKTYCRVSIGTMDEMKMFVSAFQGLA